MRTLLGHAQVETAAACLSSLLRFSAEPVELTLHDDGSLTAADAERLRSELGGVEVVGREEADERVGELLARHPASRAFRAENPLALKLLDVMLLAPGEALAYCDADVLFLRPFAQLFRFPAHEVAAVFMADTQHAYSVRSWQLLLEPRLRLARAVNTGIIHFRKAAYDLDRLEWFLARDRFRRRTPVWAEQTAWAFLAGGTPCHLYDAAQVRFPPARPPAPDPAVALHFISPLRARLPAFLEPTPAPPRRAEPVVVATRPGGRCGPLRLAAAELARHLPRQTIRETSSSAATSAQASSSPRRLRGR